MIYCWIATALLAGSWLFGLDYYYPASPLVHTVLIAAALGLLAVGCAWPKSEPIQSAKSEPIQTPRSQRIQNAVGHDTADRPPAPAENVDLSEALQPHSILPEAAWARAAIALLVVPAAVWMSWPYRLAPLLAAVGLAATLIDIPQQWLRRLCWGSFIAGMILHAQAAAIAVYGQLTARSHDLPWPLPGLLAIVAQALGIEAAAQSDAVVLHSMRQVHRLGATWDLLLDPATLCFAVGALVVFGLQIAARGTDQRAWPLWRPRLALLAVVIGCWLPLRAGGLMAVYLQRVLRTDWELPLHAMNHLFSPWVLLLLLAVPVLAIWWFTGPGKRQAHSGEQPAEKTQPAAKTSAAPPRQEGSPADEPVPPANPDLKGGKLGVAAPIALTVTAATLLAAAIAWDPVGQPKGGRVMVVERHSMYYDDEKGLRYKWEATSRPYDTHTYGELIGYNYRLLYDYCNQYFQMSRLMGREDVDKLDDPAAVAELSFPRIDDDTLAQCDVLVIKTPTARYKTEEIEAVLRFVRNGGGLLLIGDHTNFARSGTVMNDIARQIGFAFRPDLLFGMGGDPYQQHYVPPRFPHPVVQWMPPMDFAVGCSIDPGISWGRAAIVNGGLWSMPPEYHHSNFHPVPNHCPQMRFGPFIQLWATRYGRGRVLAFTDSTIFSSACLFQPGKAELFLGMIHWLNHTNRGDPGPWLLGAGLLAAAAAVWLGFRRRGLWLPMLAAAGCGWTLTLVAVEAVSRRALPPPQPRPGYTRPLAVIDRTASRVPLARGMYPQGEDAGFGLLEQAIPRVGYFTSRRSGLDALSGDVLVIICPQQPAPEAYRRGLVDFVRNGGKLLVLDTPASTGSTANDLLAPFGLKILHTQAWKGILSLTDAWPSLAVEEGWEVSGGKAVARFGQRPVGAMADFGQGRVMALGFARMFNDTNLGGHWMLDVKGDVRKRYEVLYALLRLLVEDQPIAAQPSGEVPEPSEQIR